jgi:hypothetical protein
MFVAMAQGLALAVAAGKLAPAKKKAAGQKKKLRSRRGGVEEGSSDAGL